MSSKPPGRSRPGIFSAVGHAIPDGDCIGSLLGMHQLLKNLGKQSRMVLQDPGAPYVPLFGGKRRGNVARATA
jgi:hypothetical protein